MFGENCSGKALLSRLHNLSQDFLQYSVRIDENLHFEKIVYFEQS